MQSRAATVPAYLASLPPDRRAAIFNYHSGAPTFTKVLAYDAADNIRAAAG